MRKQNKQKIAGWGLCVTGHQEKRNKKRRGCVLETDTADDDEERGDVAVPLRSSSLPTYAGRWR